jgi:hypothetical protein
MNKEEFKRNRPADEGKDGDPNIRDESAPQPGVNTISTSKYDDENQKLTRTGADNFDESTSNEGADKTFDEIEDQS